MSAVNIKMEDQIRLKVAKLRAKAIGYDKVSFVPSPNTQQQVQQQAGGQPPEQGPNAQAVGGSGITLDEVAGMIDQSHQQLMPAIQQLQQQINTVQASIPVEEGKEGEGQLQQRIAQLEQALGVQGGGGAGAPGDPQAAMQGAPVPGQPSATPPPAQQQQPGAGMAPMPGGA